jgi:hypothetical protein
MQISINKIKVGSKLILGKYTASIDGEPEPIIWLKATANCDFISEFVIDYLVFDAREPMNTSRYEYRNSGNEQYSLSNILSFANSTDEQWYYSTHEFDAPPNRNNVHQRGYSEYDAHQGFLYYFADHEISSIINSKYVVDDIEVSSLIRLPKSTEVLGDERFQLFRSKGLRPNPSIDLLNYKPRTGFSYTSYAQFWVSDNQRRGGFIAQHIDRAGKTEVNNPFIGSGFRPVCSVKPEVIIEETDDGIFSIVPYQTEKEELCTNKDLLMLLGIPTA